MDVDLNQDPLHPQWSTALAAARGACRCGARTRQGLACRNPAMPNGRCRMHGGGSTGPRTAEGLERMRQARTTHGAYGAEARRFRKRVRLLLQAVRDAD